MSKKERREAVSELNRRQALGLSLDDEDRTVRSRLMRAAWAIRLGKETAELYEADLLTDGQLASLNLAVNKGRVYAEGCIVALCGEKGFGDDFKDQWIAGLQYPSNESLLDMIDSLLNAETPTTRVGNEFTMRVSINGASKLIKLVATEL